MGALMRKITLFGLNYGEDSRARAEAVNEINEFLREGQPQNSFQPRIEKESEDVCGDGQEVVLPKEIMPSFEKINIGAKDGDEVKKRG
jgi:hypothetical protein